MRLYLLLCLLFFTPQIIFAQNKVTEKPDSLLLLLEHKSALDTNQLNLLIEIGEWYKKKKNWSEVQAYLHKALDLTEVLHRPHKALDIINYSTRTLIQDFQAIQLIKYHNRALPKLSFFTANELKYSLNLVTKLNGLNLYSDALNLLFTLEQYLEPIEHNAKFLQWVWIYRAEIFKQINDFEHVHSSCLKGIDYANEAKDSIGVLYAKYVIGWSLIEQKKYDKALSHWMELKQDTTLIKPKSIKYQHCTEMISDCLRELNRHDEATQALQVRLALSKDAGDTLINYMLLIKNYEQAGDFVNANQTYDLGAALFKNPTIRPDFIDLTKEAYAKSLIEQKRYTDAKEMMLPIFEKAKLFLGEKVTIEEYMDVLAILIDANKYTNYYEKAFFYQNKLLTLKDSIQNKKSSQRAIKMAAIHQESRNRVEMDSLSVQNKQQARFLWLSGGVSLLFLSLGGVIWRQSKNLKKEKKKSEDLILNMLPRSIAKRMKSGENSIADHFDEATIVFIDMVGFTSFSSDNSPEKVLTLLNTIFSIMDQLTDKYGLEKIKTIGDCYMAVCGVPIPKEDHLERSINFCLAVFEEMKAITFMDKKIEFKIGMETGPAIAGIIGEKRFLFDLWGDTVNVASRMESNGKPGYIQTTKNVADKMEGIFDFQSGGTLDVKGKGAIEVFVLKG